jgi:hypothetical protein
MLNLRGGGNEDKNRHEIPYLTNIKFQWNGLPMIDFIEKIIYPLNMGLGSFSMGKPGRTATLLITAKKRDPGGLFGVPTTATAPADIKFEHGERVERLFCCIMNYIDHRSEFYKFAMRHLDNDGIVLYSYMTLFGNMAVPARIATSREDYYKRMTFDSTRCPYAPHGIFVWAETVMAHGRVCKRSANDMRTKFVNGLPAFFSKYQANLKANTTCVYPATYGLIPGLAGSAIAATAHPFAGDPDIIFLARSCFADWCEELSNTNKYTPHGLVRSMETIIEDSPEIASMAAENITPKHKCDVCGGEGHTASFYLKDEKILCPTKLLSKMDLPGYKAKAHLLQEKDDAKAAELISQLNEKTTDQERMIEQLQQHIYSLEKDLTYKLSVYDKRRVPRPKSSHSRSSEPHTSRAHAMEDESSEHFEDDDTDDASSQGSVVQPDMFAEQALKDKRKMKKRY